MQKDDWRIMNQDDYLQNKTLYLHRFDKWSNIWDHEHCAFCFTKFSKKEGDAHEGYSTLDDYYWICTDCYNDFKKAFSWYELDADNYPLHDFKEILKKEIGLLQGKEIYSVKRVTHLLEKFALTFEFVKPVEITPAVAMLSSDWTRKHAVVRMESSCCVQNVSEALQAIKNYNQELSKEVSSNCMLCIGASEPKIRPLANP